MTANIEHFINPNEYYFYHNHTHNETVRIVDKNYLGNPIIEFSNGTRKCCFAIQLIRQATPEEITSFNTTYTPPSPEPLNTEPPIKKPKKPKQSKSKNKHKPDKTQNTLF